ncbi:MAG TPA: HDOD domain-containing protein [Gemmatimonadales bacterium]
MELLLARQPIFDRHERVVAYALLHQGVHPALTGSEAYERAERLLVDAALGSGIEQLTGGKPAHVKASPGMITGNTVRLLDPRRLTLELRGDALEDAAVREACVGLAAAGYDLALDGFVHTPAAAAVLPSVRTVKVDVRGRTTPELAWLAEQVRPHRARLLAEHADNRTVRDACLSLGFELFQGWRFAQPETLSRRDFPIQHVQTFKLLKALRDPATHESAIEDGFRRDVALSYKLLRMVNSAAMGGRGIWSIGHAVRLLGREALYRWLSLLLLSSAADDGVKREVLHASLVRARLCELLAGDAGLRPASGPLFLVGVFSLLDVIMTAPMSEVVSRLDVDAEVAAALERREGFFGAMLALVEAYESGAWDAVALRCMEVGVEPETLCAHYMEALGWARERMGQLMEPAAPVAVG